MTPHSPKVRFIPECHADTALVRFLTNNFLNIDHESGIGAVSKNFQEVKDQSFTLVGIVDNDKRKPPYLDDFEEIEQADGVSLKKPGKEHYVIVISPAFERFLMRNCTAIGKTLAECHLPGELRGLRKITKKPTIGQNEGFQTLLADLQKQSAPGISALQKMLIQFLDSGE